MSPVGAASRQPFPERSQACAHIRASSVMWRARRIAGQSACVHRAVRVDPETHRFGNYALWPGDGNYGRLAPDAGFLVVEVVLRLRAVVRVFGWPLPIRVRGGGVWWLGRIVQARFRSGLRWCCRRWCSGTALAVKAVMLPAGWLAWVPGVAGGVRVWWWLGGGGRCCRGLGASRCCSRLAEVRRSRPELPSAPVCGG